MSGPREVEVRWGVAVETPGMRQLRVECADEVTTMTFIGPPVFDESDPEAVVSGPMAEAAIAEHQAHCASCQAWRAAS